jgi:hypothetical protein
MAAQVKPEPEPTCPHDTVISAGPVVTHDGPKGDGYFLRQIGVCRSCRKEMVRVTDLTRFKPWREVRGVGKR